MAPMSARCVGFVRMRAADAADLASHASTHAAHAPARSRCSSVARRFRPRPRGRAAAAARARPRLCVRCVSRVVAQTRKQVTQDLDCPHASAITSARSSASARPRPARASGGGQRRQVEQRGDALVCAQRVKVLRRRGDGEQRAERVIMAPCRGRRRTVLGAHAQRREEQYGGPEHMVDKLHAEIAAVAHVVAR